MKRGVEIALNNLGLGSKAQSEDLLSVLDNDNEDWEVDTGARKRKNLKLPAIYDSVDYRSHPYLGLVEPDDDQDEDNKWGEKKDLDENPNYLD